MTGKFCHLQHQKGITLLVGLTMLLLITLIAISAIRLATTNMQVVGNEQFRDETQAAANFVLDQVINDKDFVITYTQTEGINYPSVSVGQESYKVFVPKMTCKRTNAIKNDELVTKEDGEDTVTAADRPCISGQSSTSTLIVGGTGDSGSGSSLCSNVLWDIEARVEAAETTGATSTVHQGVEVRVDSTEAMNNCK